MAQTKLKSTSPSFFNVFVLFQFIVQFHLISITQLTSFVLRHIRHTSNYLICATRTVLLFSVRFFVQLSSCFWARRLITINLWPMIVVFFSVANELMMTGWHMVFGRDLFERGRVIVRKRSLRRKSAQLSDLDAVFAQRTA